MGIDSIIIEKLTIPSSLTSLVLVESLIDRVCNTIHVNEDVYGNVLIGVTEAVNNAIIHGNLFSDSKTVSIEVSEDESSFYFRISDEGLGFDYLNLPDPTAPENIEKENGRGIFLIKNLADELIYENNGASAIIVFNK
jgi:serine/threonine-protein kinase RsbW